MPRPDIDINNPNDLARARADHDWWARVAPPNCELIGWTDREWASFSHRGSSFQVSGVMAAYVHTLLNRKEST